MQGTASFSHIQFHPARGFSGCSFSLLCAIPVLFVCFTSDSAFRPASGPLVSRQAAERDFSEGHSTGVGSFLVLSDTLLGLSCLDNSSPVWSIRLLLGL